MLVALNIVFLILTVGNPFHFTLKITLFSFVAVNLCTGGSFRAASARALYALLDSHSFLTLPASIPLTGIPKALGRAASFLVL